MGPCVDTPPCRTTLKVSKECHGGREEERGKGKTSSNGSKEDNEMNQLKNTSADATSNHVPKSRRTCYERSQELFHIIIRQ
jgi:hypothetical protein